VPKELRQLSPSRQRPVRAQSADSSQHFERERVSHAPLQSASAHSQHPNNHSSCNLPSPPPYRRRRDGLRSEGLGNGNTTNLYAKGVVDDEACAICLDPLLSLTRQTGAQCSLPCGHSFHGACVAGLRAFGVTQACPLCRADLPPGPERLYEQACRKYVALEHKVTSSSAAGRGSHLHSTTDVDSTTWFADLNEDDQKELHEVLSLWRGAAAQGCAGSANNLGLMAERGCGVVQSEVEAARWYATAADAGDAGAAYNLGEDIFTCIAGSYTRYNKLHVYQETFTLCRCDVTYVLNVLALLMTQTGCVLERGGGGVPQSNAQAAKWWRRAAESGYPPAQLELGLLHLHGRGVAQSTAKAAMWLQRASSGGLKEAHYHLGLLCGYGDCDRLPVSSTSMPTKVPLLASGGSHGGVSTTDVASSGVSVSSPAEMLGTAVATTTITVGAASASNQASTGSSALAAHPTLAALWKLPAPRVDIAAVAWYECGAALGDHHAAACLAQLLLLGAPMTSCTPLPQLPVPSTDPPCLTEPPQRAGCASGDSERSANFDGFSGGGSRREDTTSILAACAEVWAPVPSLGLDRDAARSLARAAAGEGSARARLLVEIMEAMDQAVEVDE